MVGPSFLLLKPPEEEMGSVPEKQMRSLGGVADAELRCEPVVGVGIREFIGRIPNLSISLFSSHPVTSILKLLVCPKCGS